MKQISKLPILFLMAFYGLGDIPGTYSQSPSSQNLKTSSTDPGSEKSNHSQLKNRKRIVFLTLLQYKDLNSEGKAAFDFLQSNDNYTAEILTFSDLQKHPKVLKSYDLVWVHRPDTSEFQHGEINAKVLQSIKEYVSTGGRLFLTLNAMKYLVPLGIETESPADSIKACIDEGYGRKLGFHAYFDHPVFAGLNGGSYIWRPDKDLRTRILGYFGDHVPKNGKVIAVDWDYIFIRENSKLVLEYDYGQGKIIAAGAYTFYSQPNFNRQHLEMFTNNVFHYLIDGDTKILPHYWDYEPSRVVGCPEETQTDRFLIAVPESVAWPVKDDPLTLCNRFASENYWDVSGERLLTMGKETSGIEEVWAHPFMALRDYEVGIRFSYRDTTYWLNDERPEIEVRPASFTRIYKFPRAYLTETIVNDPIDPSGVVHYDYKGVYEAELVVRFKSNLRLMWPYPENVTEQICYTWNGDLNAYIIQDKSGEWVTIIGGNRQPYQSLIGQFSSFNYDQAQKKFQGITSNDFLVSGLLTFSLKMNDKIDIVFCATNEGVKQTKYYFNKAIHDPIRILLNSDSSFTEILSKRLMITTPDKDFNLGYRWALMATERLFVNTPGMGKSLVAGYSTTKRGWDGGQKVSGRPGYGWYFGRDGEWSGMALLDCGASDKVKSILEFYQNYQDLSGKIFHEATTSGVIHYDAADATPLYIILAGKYFRHTNDTTFLIKSWPTIKKAIDFCFSTDSDRDHLIENTNVGHGWVEGGELYGSHATLYLNSCWAEALGETYNMSKALQQPESESYSIEARTLKRIINTDFWNKEKSFYSYGKNKDGSFRSEPTILPAVALGFRLAEREKANLVLQQYASNTFTTNWGTRIISDDSPLFNPKGYHYGSVWPLFTGWTSMAEYANGNYLQGFSHIMNNLNVFKNWGLGFVEEVLNGSEYQPSGVCPHQCWSETMVLQPAIEGMLGLVVKAQENKIILSPHLPADWDSLKVDNIRVGNQSFDFKYNRQGPNYTFQFLPKGNVKIKLEFLPSFPAGTLFKKVLQNGQEASVAIFKTTQYNSLLVSSEITTPLTINTEVDKGISVLPVIQNPKPGDHAAGLRIISTNLTGNQFSVIVEGATGSSEILNLYLNGQEIDKVENGTLISRNENILKVNVKFEPSIHKYQTKTLIITIKK